METEQSFEKKKFTEEQVLELASDLHNKQWKETFKKQNPEAKTRIKINVMGKWKNYPQDLEKVSEAEKVEMEKIAKENPTFDTPGVCEDILNTPFEKLSEKWQAENVGAARFALELVTSATESDDLESLADKVHQNWSKNNSWDNLSKIPYGELPEMEKEKDRQQILWAKNLLQ